MSIDSPLTDQRKQQLNEIILKPQNRNPFPAPPNRIDFFSNRPKFICGREAQITKIRKIIERSINEPEPKLIEILGKQGIGKSTLICWIYELMKAENKLQQSPMVFLNSMGNPEDYQLLTFYKQVISSINLSELLKDLALRTMQQFIRLLEQMGGKCADSLRDKFSVEEIKQFQTNFEFIRDKVQRDNDIIGKIIDLYKINFTFIQDQLNVNPKFIITLWSAFDRPSSYNALQALMTSGSFSDFHIQTDSDAYAALKDIISINNWLNNQSATLIVVFDHLEACITDKKTETFNTLFSILLRLRQLNHLTIVLSGTLDAFDAMDTILRGDQKSQLDNWADSLSLSSLSAEEVIEIVKNYCNLFWRDKLYSPPPNYELYPFGPNAIRYIYDCAEKDLRDALRRLYEKVETFREVGKVRMISKFFDAIREYRSRKDLILSTFEQQFFIEQLMGKNFQDKERSSKVEEAIQKLCEIVRTDPQYNFLSDVKHEPPIGPNGEKPDVFLEFFGRSVAQKVKKVAIEVKVFTKTNEVPTKDIDKTHILLEAEKVDYVIWFSNVSLSIGKYNLSERFKSHLGRTCAMDTAEMAYVAFAHYFEEIFERDPIPQEAAFLLEKMGLDLDKLQEELTELEPLVKEPQERLTIPQKTAGDLLGLLKKQTEPPVRDAPQMIHTEPMPSIIAPAPPRKKSTRKITTRKLVEMSDDSLTEPIKTIITDKNTQNSMKITSVITDLKTHHKIEAESEEDKNRVMCLTRKIAEEMGYKTKGAIIKFT